MINKAMVLLLFVLTLAGCGSEGDQSENGQPGGNSQEVLPTVMSVRQAVVTSANLSSVNNMNLEYTVNGEVIDAVGVHSAPINAAIRLNILIPGMTLSFEQDTSVRQVVRNLFSAFSNVTIAINGDNIPLPTHANIISTMEELGVTNVIITNYTVGSYNVPSTGILTPMPTDSAVRVAAFFTRINNVSDAVVTNAVRNLFNSFTGSKTINIAAGGVANPVPPTHTQIIQAVELAGGGNVNISTYTVGGVAISASNTNPASATPSDIINLTFTYTFTGSDTSTVHANINTELSRLFVNFTNNANSINFTRVDAVINSVRLPSHQSIISTVQALGANNVQINTYRAGVRDIPNTADPGMAEEDTNITVNISFDRNGDNPSDTLVRSEVAALFGEFTGIVNITPLGRNWSPLPTRQEIIREVELLGGRNVSFFAYTANGISTDGGNTAPSSSAINLDINFDRTGATPGDATVVAAINVLFQNFTGTKTIRAVGTSK